PADGRSASLRRRLSESNHRPPGTRAMSRSVSLRVVESPRAQPNGVVVHRGPSLIDGADVIVILTGLAHGSANQKTGDMVQSWILRGDRAPVEALKDGSDRSVCGDCVHRTHDGAGSCYVNVAQAPQSVYHAWRRGAYPAASPQQAAELCAGRAVRLG